jgi:nicotinate-nucleotide adenylyltransferase
VGQRIGVLGGTFDPVHLGHLSAASHAVSGLGLDQVLFVPAGQPWQKQSVQASGRDRFAMVSLAIEGVQSFAVSRLEIDREGPTYTIDTLRALRSWPQYEQADLFFITGADAIAEIDSWKDHDQLAQLAAFVAVTRPGFDPTTDPDGATLAVPVIRLDVPGLDISSTLIRQRVARGESIDDLTAPNVVRYIDEHRLYSEPDLSSAS